MENYFHGKIILLPRSGKNDFEFSFQHPAVMKIFALCQLTGVSCNPPRLVVLPPFPEIAEAPFQNGLLFELLKPSLNHSEIKVLAKIFSAWVDLLSQQGNLFDVVYLKPPYKVQFD